MESQLEIIKEQKEYESTPADGLFTQSNLQNSFNSVMTKLKFQIGKDSFQSWFASTRFEKYSRCIIFMSVPTRFLRTWIDAHYSELLLELWKTELKSVLRVEIIERKIGKVLANTAEISKDEAKNQIINNVVNDKMDMLNYGACHKKSNKKSNISVSQYSFSGSPLDSYFTFNNFIEGPSNRLALAAAKAVSEKSNNYENFNPLFIHSQVGMGKTHLLQAIAHEAKKTGGYRVVVYLTAEYFMWQFATAIRDHKTLNLKEQLRNIDLLIIDDLQFLQGKSIQNEFCHLLNMLLDNAKHVVVAADRQPYDLESLDPRVRSRLVKGVSLGIDMPDYDMRLNMLKRRLDLVKQKEKQIDIDKHLLEHIAASVKGSGRDIEGAFNQIILRQSFDGRLDEHKIDDLLGQISRSTELRRIKIEEIQQIVARHFNLSKNDMLSASRMRNIVKPRQIAMYLAKSLTPRSLPEIGRRFGGRDHTTVLHAIRKIESQIINDQKLGKELELLKRLINEQTL